MTKNINQVVYFSAGETLGSKWNKIRAKYRLYHQQGRQTEQDHLLKFLDPYIRNKKSKKMNKKVDSHVLDDSVLLIDSEELPEEPNLQDDIISNVDSEIIFDLVPEESAASKQGFKDLETEKIQTKLPPKQMEKKSDTSKEKSCYRLAIAQAFLKEIEEEDRIDAMMYICQKLKELQKKREAQRQLRNGIAAA